MSASPGTVRVLHHQAPPFAHSKLLRVVRGRVYDVEVDARVGSPTYCEHIYLELTVERGDGESFVGSDAVALAGRSRNVMYLKEGNWDAAWPEGAVLRGRDGREV